MRTWAFVSQKGGSGKSTLSTQLAVHATEQGERVLIVDLDPQGSAEIWHERRGVDRHPGALRCLPNNLGKVLDGAENLKHTLVVIDTAPHTEKGMIEAIRLANLIVCPTQASLFDLASLAETARLLGLAGRKDDAVVVVNCVPPGKTEKQTIKEAAAAVATYGLALCKTHVCHRWAFVTTTNGGKGVTEVATDKKAADEIRRLWVALNALSPPTKKRLEIVK